MAVAFPRIEPAQAKTFRQRAWSPGSTILRGRAMDTYRMSCQGSLTQSASTFDNGSMSDAWGNWQRLRQDPEADPIEVLRAISAFQKYFAAIEREAVKVARAQNRTWHQIGAALGRSRQAIWQRAASRVDESKAADWQALSRLLEDSWATSAEVRHSIGMPPPQ
jgi:hypothetical protein